MWLTNLRIVLPERTIARGTLWIAGGRVAAIVEREVGQGGVDCRGLTAIPGIVDLHGDMLEREVEPRTGVEFPLELAMGELDKRLAANGVTTAYVAVSFHDLGMRKSMRTPDRGRRIAHMLSALQGSMLVDMRLHARFEVAQPGLVPLVAELVEEGYVQLLSLNDHTPGQGQWRDIERYIQHGAVARGLSRDEFAAMTHARIERAREQPAGLAAVEAVVARAARQGLPIASHDDDTPAKVSEVAILGATISEFPVTLEAAQAARERGMWIVMGAPNVLRGSSHSGNLSAREAIAAGLVDILASDYAPVALLQAAFRLATEGVLPLHEAVALITANPAAALGLAERGTITPGSIADLVLVEDGAFPRVRGTLRGGLPIYWDGAMAARVAAIDEQQEVPDALRDEAVPSDRG